MTGVGNRKEIIVSDCCKAIENTVHKVDRGGVGNRKEMLVSDCCKAIENTIHNVDRGWGGE